MKKNAFPMILIVLASGLFACSGPASGTNAEKSLLETRVTAPEAGETYPFGALTVEAVSERAKGEGSGVSLMTLIVDGQPVSGAKTDPSAASVSAQFSWTPADSGVYHLVVQSFAETELSDSDPLTACVSKTEIVIAAGTLDSCE